MTDMNMNEMSKTIKRFLFAAAAAVILAGCASPSQDAGGGSTQAEQENGAAEGTAQPAAGDNGAQEQASAQTEEGDKEDGKQEDTAAGRTSGAETVKEENVTVVIPTVYEDVKTQEEADEIRDRNGYVSAVLNEDGSLVIVMSRSQYDEMIRSFKESVDKGIAEIVGTGGGSSIEKIEYNDDYSIFTVTVSEDEIGTIERQAASELIMYGTLYHVYTGNDVEQIRVDYVSAGSGEIIETADSGDLDSAY